MDDVFLYLFGAGASINALPLADEFPKRLIELRDNLKVAREDLEFNRDIEDALALKWEPELMESLEWLSDKAEQHTTVDTLARRLLLTREIADLSRLKATVAAFFLLEESMKKVDSRYDAFYATILDTDDYGDPTLPGKLRIATWNYDMQFERAFWPYGAAETPVFKQITRKIIRMNGASGYDPAKMGLSAAMLHSISGFNCTTYLSVLEMFAVCRSHEEHHMTDIEFAWEQDESARLKETMTTAQLSEVTVLVVIGYSFPYFNREIDMQTLSELKKNLRTVYLQVSPEHQNPIKDRIYALVGQDDLKIHPVSDLDRFYVPYEF